MKINQNEPEKWNMQTISTDDYPMECMKLLCGRYYGQALQDKERENKKSMETHSAKHLSINSGVVVSGRNGGASTCAAA